MTKNGKRRLIEYTLQVKVLADPTNTTDPGLLLAAFEAAIEDAGGRIVKPASWRVVRVPAEAAEG